MPLIAKSSFSSSFSSKGKEYPTSPDMPPFKNKTPSKRGSHAERRFFESDDDDNNEVEDDGSPVLMGKRGAKHAGGVPLAINLTPPACSAATRIATASPKPPPRHLGNTASPRTNSIKVVPPGGGGARMHSRPAMLEVRHRSKQKGLRNTPASWVVDDKGELEDLLGCKQGEDLGVGSNGIVRKRVWRGRPVAVKQLKAEKHYDEAGVTMAEARQVLVDEAEVLSCLDHPNITRVVSLVKSKDEAVVFLVQELCDCNVRLFYLRLEDKDKMAKAAAQKGAFAADYLDSSATGPWLPPGHLVLKWCRELAAAIEYLHCDLDSPLLHRDVRPEK